MLSRLLICLHRTVVSFPLLSHSVRSTTPILLFSLHQSCLTRTKTSRSIPFQSYKTVNVIFLFQITSIYLRGCHLSIVRYAFKFAWILPFSLRSYHDVHLTTTWHRVIEANRCAEHHTAPGSSLKIFSIGHRTKARWLDAFYFGRAKRDAFRISRIGVRLYF